LVTEIVGDLDTALVKRLGDVNLSEMGNLTEDAFFEHVTVQCEEMLKTDDDAEVGAALKLMEEAVENGVDIRSAVGQRFSRCPDGGKNKEYQALSRKGKVDFRRAWAQNQVKKLKDGKIKGRSFNVVDAKIGTYMSFTKIHLEEGGDRAALKAARNYVMACLMMSGAWTRWNPMTRRRDFLYVRYEHSEKFTKSWKMFEEWGAGRPGGGGDGGGKEPGAPGGGGGRVAVEDDDFSEPEVDEDQMSEGGNDDEGGDGGKPSKANKAASKAKAKAKGGKPPTPSKEDDPKKKAFADLLTKGNKLKTQYQVLYGKASQMVTSISSQKSWIWARGGHEEKVLGALLSELNEVQTEFCRGYLSLDQKDISKTFTHEQLEVGCQYLLDKVKPVMMQLEKLLGKINSKHAKELQH